MMYEDLLQYVKNQSQISGDIYGLSWIRQTTRHEEPSRQKLKNLNNGAEVLNSYRKMLLSGLHNLQKF